MSLTTTNGMTIDDLNTAPNGPGLVQQLGNQVDAFYGGNVANAGALPVSGDFPGQRIWLVDVKGWGVWNGSAWVSDATASATYATNWSTISGEVTAVDRVGGVVTFHLAAIKSAASTTGETICTLPAGFRPRRKTRLTGNNSGASRGVTISTAGVVTNDIAQADAGTSAVVGTVSFAVA